MPWAALELAENELAGDRDDVGPVERNGGDVEDTGDGDIGPETNQVDGDTPENAEPYSKDRCTSECADFGPETGARNKAIAREGENSAGKSLHGGEAHKLQDDKGANCEEDTGALAERVVIDLGDWLGDRGGEDFVRVAHAEGKNDIEKPTKNVSTTHGNRYGPWCLDLGLIDPD